MKVPGVHYISLWILVMTVTDGVTCVLHVAKLMGGNDMFVFEKRQVLEEFGTTEPKGNGLDAQTAGCMTMMSEFQRWVNVNGDLTV
jgi:hypothetical protein